MTDRPAPALEVLAADSWEAWSARPPTYATALGERRFDIRRFHDVVLGEGTLPLAVLRQVAERELP